MDLMVKGLEVINW